MAVAELADPGALGRVIADPEGNLRKIVEARDATPEEQEIRLVNAGLYALPARAIFGYLDRLTPQNAQGELYLTDALGAAAADGHPIRLLPLTDPLESLGVNNRAELAEVDRLLGDRRERRERLPDDRDFKEREDLTCAESWATWAAERWCRSSSTVSPAWSTGGTTRPEWW